MTEAIRMLGDMLKKHRHANALSIRAFSQKAGIRHSEVLHIEKGVRAAPPLTLIRAGGCDGDAA